MGSQRRQTGKATFQVLSVPNRENVLSTFRIFEPQSGQSCCLRGASDSRCKSPSIIKSKPFGGMTEKSGRGCFFIEWLLALALVLLPDSQGTVTHVGGGKMRET